MLHGLGIDISHWNTVDDIRSAIANGTEFGFAKCTEASGSTDAVYATNVHLLRSAKIHVGHYHKAVDSLHPSAELDNFAAHVDLRPGEAVMFDIESMTGNWQEIVVYVCWILVHAQARFKCVPYWYCNKDYLNNMLAVATPAQINVLHNYPLWIAAPSDPMGHPVISHDWFIHQYATVNNIDRDYYNPIAKPWSVYAVPVPKPIVTPAPAPVTPPVTPVVTPPVNPAPIPPTIPTQSDPTAPAGEHSGSRIQDL